MSEERFRLTKLEAAHRQLAGAIRLLFDGGDPVMVHTLVGAAPGILSGMIEKKAPSKSWDLQAQEATGTSKSDYFRIMRKTQNFLKHADDVRDGAIDFDTNETEALVFWTVLNAAELAPMPLEAQVYQLWYLASHTPAELEDDTLVPEMVRDLRGKTRAERLRYGAESLKRALSNSKAS